MQSTRKACALAAARAPSLTGKLGLKIEIVTGEDLAPMLELLETLGKTSTFQRADATTYQKLYNQGKMPPVLLMGADLSKAINWNCGGCGFPTCGEFNQYKSKNKGVGIGAYGPSCLWKVIDLGMAADYACACAAMHRVEARIQFSMGASSMFLGRLEGCSLVLGLPLGPVGSDIWFDRRAWQGEIDYQTALRMTMAGAPNMYMAFTGGGAPIIKSKQQWWENPTWMKVEQDENIENVIAEGQAAAYEVVMRNAGVLDEKDE